MEQHVQMLSFGCEAHINLANSPLVKRYSDQWHFAECPITFQSDSASNVMFKHIIFVGSNLEVHLCLLIPGTRWHLCYSNDTMILKICNPNSINQRPLLIHLFILFISQNTGEYK